MTKKSYRSKHIRINSAHYHQIQNIKKDNEQFNTLFPNNYWSINNQLLNLKNLMPLINIVCPNDNIHLVKSYCNLPNRKTMYALIFHY